MIRRCSCGNMVTRQPWRSAKEWPWICDECVDREAAKARYHTRKAIETAVEVETAVAASRRKKFSLVR